MSTLYIKWLFISLLLFCTYLLKNLATCSVRNHLILVITKYGKNIFLMEMAKHPSSFTNLGHCRLQKNSFWKNLNTSILHPKWHTRCHLYCDLAVRISAFPKIFWNQWSENQDLGYFLHNATNDSAIFSGPANISLARVFGPLFFFGKMGFTLLQQ